jgi:hypothetical protein
MGKVVFAWEMGEGMGHIVPYLPLFESLQEQGHEVVLILKNLTHVESLIKKYQVTCLQAPLRANPIAKPIRVPCTYTHILHNNGFSDLESLAGMVKRWRALFDMLKPSLAIFDHSPSAVLASRGYDFKKIHMGTGFTIPPDVYPLPNLRTWLKLKPERLLREEDYVLGVMNRVLARFKAPPLARIGGLFSQGDRVLMTYEELDPYGPRPNEDYWGTWTTSIGEEPMWPDVPGKRIFAYLKPFPALPSLLALLNESKMPTLAYIPGLSRRMREKYASPALCFVDRPLNMERVAAECDLGILNGTHTTTANLLMAGKPTLHFPLYLEQHLTAQKVEELGAGFCAAGLGVGDIQTKLDLLLKSDSRADKTETDLLQHEEIKGSERQINAFVDARFKVVAHEISSGSFFDSNALRSHEACALRLREQLTKFDSA